MIKSEFSNHCGPTKHPSYTQNKVISRATPAGRVTLDPQNLTITTNGQKESRRVNDDTEYQEPLKTHFGIVL